jgi:uncharacterized membrane protein YqjE
MATQLDDEPPDLVSEVQDFARLHVDLARSEVRDGTRRLVRGLLLLLLAAASTGLLVFAGLVTLFLWLRTRFDPWVAAALVTVSLAAFVVGASAVGKWQLGGTKALLLPRTRTLLRELFAWRDDKPTNS